MRSQTSGLKLIKVALLTVVTQAAYASPQISQIDDRYTIAGANTAELHAQMDNLGPVVQGHRFNASTEYFVRWNIQYQQNEAGCKVTDARVMLFITQLLPEWQNYSSATPDAKRDWDVYFDRLKQHELGHVNHGLQAADEVEAMFSTLPVMASCAQLESAAKEKTDAIVEKYKKDDVDYDAVNNHGMTQNFV